MSAVSASTVQHNGRDSAQACKEAEDLDAQP